MVIVTIVFMCISLFEWNYLKKHARKAKTYWITGCMLAVAYLYVSAVYTIKNFPTLNQLIDLAFSF